MYSEALSNFTTAFDHFNDFSKLQLTEAQLFATKKVEPDLLLSLLSSKDTAIASIANKINSIVNTSAHPEHADESGLLCHLILNAHNWPDSKIQNMYNKLSAPSIKVIASAALMAKYLDSKQNDWARKYIYHIPENEKHKAYDIGELNYQYLRLLAAEGNIDELRKIVNTIYLNRTREYTRLYFQAICYEDKKSTAQANNLYLKALDMYPFCYEGIEAAVQFLIKNNQKEKAYEKIASILDLQPENLFLNKKYLEQCLQIGYISFAENTLNKIKPAIPFAEYNRYKNAIDSLLQTY
jgi:hypothetical protein